MNRKKRDIWLLVILAVVPVLLVPVVIDIFPAALYPFPIVLIALSAAFLNRYRGDGKFWWMLVLVPFLVLQLIYDWMGLAILFWSGSGRF